MNNIEREVIGRLSSELTEQGLEVVIVNPATGTQLTPPLKHKTRIEAVLQVLDSCELHVYQHAEGGEFQHLGCLLIVCDGRHGPDVIVTAPQSLHPHIRQTLEVSERLRAGAASV